MAKKNAKDAVESAPEALPEGRFDVRVVETNLRRGRITHDQYNAYLESLPDDAENAEVTKASL